MTWFDNISCGHMKESDEAIQMVNEEPVYNVEDVFEEYKMNDARIYRTHERTYVSKDNPTKYPEVGDVVATARENFKADDGYGPTEIKHYRVIEYLPNDEIRVMPLDKSQLKVETIISSKIHKYDTSYRPIFED